MRATLLLDQSFQPLATISWQKAFTLIMLEKAEMIETYEDRKIHGVNRDFDMPAVARILHRIRRPKKIVRFSRQNVLARDKWECQYCRQRKDLKELTYDHVVPRSQGGKTAWTNIVTCCRDCNSKKGGRTPAQAGMTLLSKPNHPAWIPIFIIPMEDSIPSEWKEYIYWT